MLGIPVSPEGVGNVHSLFYKKAISKALIITFVNPHACFLDSKNPGYTDMLELFDIVACDGIGMVKVARTSGCVNLHRESFDFTSLAGDVLQAAVSYGWSVGLVGGKPGVTKDAARMLTDKYPGLEVVGNFSGYGAEPEVARKFFTDNKVQLVICGMGAPLQEKFLTELVLNGWSGMGFTCGGFLDQTINWKGSYPGWIDRNDLRFLYRLIKEPRRLWRRYLIEYQVFLYRFGCLRWNQLKSKLSNSRLWGNPK